MFYFYTERKNYWLCRRLPFLKLGTLENSDPKDEGCYIIFQEGKKKPSISITTCFVPKNFQAEAHRANAILRKKLEDSSLQTTCLIIGFCNT